MKKELFLGLILFSIIVVILVVSGEDLSNSNIKTEKITCVFENSNERENCSNYVQQVNIFGGNGNLINAYPKENLTKFSCEGVSSCSIDINGDEGTKIRWESSCDGRNPQSDDIRSQGGLWWTIIDGNDKTLEFDCKRPVPLFEFIASGYDLLVSKGLYALYKDRIGFRDFYYHCYDDTEKVFNGNKSTNCNSAKELNSKFNGLCDNLCDKNNNCGLSGSGFSEICIIDK